jgi:hypothetical protein
MWLVVVHETVAMVRTFLPICGLCAVLGCLGGCQNLLARRGLPKDPLFIARTPIQAQATQTAPAALARVDPTPPPVPVEMQDRPSLAQYEKPGPPALRAPDNPADVTGAPRTPGVLTNQPRRAGPLPPR